jgi:trehalose 6-phosphate phosphatase
MHNEPVLVAPPTLASLRSVHPISLFLDFDGTLVDIADAPDNVIIPDNLAAHLQSLSLSLAGRLAIITGRPLAALDKFLGPPHLLAVGSHGAEFRGAPPPPPPLSEASLASIARLVQAWPNLIVEPKPFGIAVHYRQEPDAASSVVKLMKDIGQWDGLAVKLGKMVIEVGPLNANKGSAVRQLMSENPFAPSLPIFIGDDVTDEDGFAAVRDLGGFGILVGPPRKSAARYILPDPPAILRWLQF